MRSKYSLNLEIQNDYEFFNVENTYINRPKLQQMHAADTLICFDLMTYKKKYKHTKAMEAKAVLSLKQEMHLFFFAK